MQQDPDIEALRRDAERGIPAAEYNLGVWNLTAPGEAADYRAALRLFESAGSKDFAPALSALGYMHLRGQGVPIDAGRAAELFRQAAALDFPEASYRLGELLATGCGVHRDLQAARAAFRDAARHGHTVAMSQLAYCLSHGIGGDGDPVEAAQLYVRAAIEGEPRAQCRVAAGYETGDMFPADPERALVWYLRAGNYGDARGACQRLVGALDPDQVRRAGDAAAAPAVDPGEVGKAEPGRPPDVQVLCWSPRIFLFNNFLSGEECHHLINLARPFLRAAMVLNRRTGEKVHDQARTSRNARLINPIRDVLVDHVESRLAQCSLLPRENGEPITILRYGPGDEYKPHSDYYDPRHPGSSTGLALGGQRIATFLAYLNSVEAGGATTFPRIGLSVAPRPGTGLLFFNCEPDGTPDKLTLHAGEPVETGKKWLLSRWIRTGVYPLTGG
ncbi:MAG: 2OG-Fe(II) oxygenase [Gammaproteobacteria bacterium]|jgi:prolyl 4-hydroxylase